MICSVYFGGGGGFGTFEFDKNRHVQLYLM